MRERKREREMTMDEDDKVGTAVPNEEGYLPFQKASYHLSSGDGSLAVIAVVMIRTTKG